MLSAARRSVRLPVRTGAARAFATEHNPPTRFESSSVFPDEPQQPAVKTDSIPGTFSGVETDLVQRLIRGKALAGPKSREQSAAISQFQDPRAHVVVAGALHAVPRSQGFMCADLRHGTLLTTDYLKSKGASSQDPPLPTLRRRNKTSRCATSSQATTSWMSTATRCSTSLPKSPGESHPDESVFPTAVGLTLIKPVCVPTRTESHSFSFSPRSIAIGYNNPELLALAKTVSRSLPQADVPRTRTLNFSLPFFFFFQDEFATAA